MLIFWVDFAKEKSMIRTNRRKRKGKPGPKSKCTPTALKTAEVLFGELGATQAQVAKVLGVGTGTLEKWIQNRPDFKNLWDSVKLKKGAKAAHGLFLRATGFTVPEEKIFYDKEKGVIRAETYKYYPPDTSAAIQFLSIMFREQWANPSTINHLHSGTVSHEHRKIDEIPIEEMSESEKDLILSLGMKQLEQTSEN